MKQGFKITMATWLKLGIFQPMKHISCQTFYNMGFSIKCDMNEGVETH
jgi:hypothetical protein